METGAWELVDLVRNLSYAVALVISCIAGLEKIFGFPSNKVRDLVYGLAMVWLLPNLIMTLNTIFSKVWGR